MVWLQRKPVPVTSAPFVSTGRLPVPERVRALLTEAYDLFGSNDEKAVSTA
jgi:hypothetical protein